MGSDVLRQKKKILLLAAVAGGMAVLLQGWRDGGQGADFALYREKIIEIAGGTLFPAASYGEGSLDWAGNLADKITRMAGHIFFPVQDYDLDYEKSQDLYTADEYYPPKDELEAMARNNGDFDNEEDFGQNMDQTQARNDDQDQDGTKAQGDDESLIPAVATPANGVIYSRQSLYDYNFLMNNFYITDSSTSSDASLINGETLLNRDLTLDLTGDDPVILIYHTHSQEKFADSRDGYVEDTVVGLGNTLTSILQEKYKISVYHDTGVYDMIDGVEDRNEAYSLAQEAITSILAQNPSIKVVIDLHRDGVAQDTHLVTEVNKKPTAQIMFFNGLCRNANNDTAGYLQNPYLTDNLAFSLQMQLKAAEKYPGFTRRIYLRDYRYNMHLCPRSLLVECGAQTNTVEEAQNAMEPLADLLYCVLSGQ